MSAPSTDFNAAKPQGIAWTPAANDMVLSEVLGFARRGWAVIPVNPFTKAPFLKEWQNLGGKDVAAAAIMTEIRGRDGAGSRCSRVLVALAGFGLR